MASLGHPNLVTARHFMTEAVRLWDERNTNRAPHALADLLLNPDHPKGIRCAVDSFIAGNPIREDLQPYAGGLAGMRTSERIVYDWPFLE